MARPKTPAARTRVSGADLKNPKRYRGKVSEGQLRPLGRPSAWLGEAPRTVWTALQAELPWLTEADRALMEITAILRARMTCAEPAGVQAMNQLRLCLGMLGAMPSDRSKVTMPEPSDDDPEDHLFN